MRKVSLTVAGLVAIWAITSAAIQPPRVIELTDGSIQFYSVEWSPDGKRLAALSQDGVWIIEAKERVQPQRINNLQLNVVKWLSDSLLVGAREEKVPGQRFKRVSKLFLFNDRGDFVSSEDGFVGGWPTVTVSGAVVYDSAAVLVGYRVGNRLATIDKRQEVCLINRRPRGFARADSDTTVGLWFQSIDRHTLAPIVRKRDFAEAKMSGDGSRILAWHAGDALSIFTFDGNLTAEVQAPQDRENDGFIASISEADLSPDNNLLLSIRGLDDIQHERELGTNIYLQDLRTGEEVQVTHEPSTFYSGLKFNDNGQLAISSAGAKIIMLIF